ncbi:hypothetical protein [Bradyrhizobium sp. WSM471]|uniref:hypothetical protein n=1 Tax=Bradyrhizobium sp. WSM471 TaxID=319017 RepID=UPI00024D1AB1|nr:MULTISPECIES: hypothetical protein [Bradyrhizobium]EHR00188.1 hypothetical protein Bra471DRAFT_00734 [Bradyrhizobium sp. WSM471]UFW42309.1 hypothetical protein BcanWSM471_03615 [Bradyrhizobium canariense]
MSENDAQKYASAFATDVQAFIFRATRGETDSERLARVKLNRAKSEDETARERRREAIAERLRFARRVRGLFTVGSATEYTGLTYRMVSTHENAINAMSERVAEAYCFGYGIKLPWLLHGSLPSGLGDQVDQIWSKRRDTSDLKELAEICQTIATPFDPPGGALVHTAFEQATAKESAPATAGERVYDLNSESAWELPTGILSKMIGSKPDDVVVIVLDRDFGVWKSGDRVFVDSSKRDTSPGGLFALQDKSYFRSTIRRFVPGESLGGEGDWQLLGKVVATFSWHKTDDDLRERYRDLIQID